MGNSLGKMGTSWQNSRGETVVAKGKMMMNGNGRGGADPVQTDPLQADIDRVASGYEKGCGKGSQAEDAPPPRRPGKGKMLMSGNGRGGKGEAEWRAYRVSQVQTGDGSGFGNHTGLQWSESGQLQEVQCPEPEENQTQEAHDYEGQ